MCKGVGGGHRDLYGGAWIWFMCVSRIKIEKELYDAFKHLICLFLWSAAAYLFLWEKQFLQNNLETGNFLLSK